MCSSSTRSSISQFPKSALSMVDSPLRSQLHFTLCLSSLQKRERQFRLPCKTTVTSLHFTSVLLDMIDHSLPACAITTDRGGKKQNHCSEPCKLQVPYGCHGIPVPTKCLLKFLAELYHLSAPPDPLWGIPCARAAPSSLI